jgi:hypothetical protein
MDRESIIAEVWERLSEVTGVTRTARNPVNPPAEEDYPFIALFEDRDRVVDQRMRGATDLPTYKRILPVVIEVYILASSEMSASKELGAFVLEVKRKVYEGGITLGIHGVSIKETGASEVYRPEGLEKVAGIGLFFDIQFTEDLQSILST